jgi:hypothetical protein
VNVISVLVGRDAGLAPQPELKLQIHSYFAGV